MSESKVHSIRGKLAWWVTITGALCIGIGTCRLGYLTFTKWSQQRELDARQGRLDYTKKLSGGRVNRLNRDELQMRDYSVYRSESALETTNEQLTRESVSLLAIIGAGIVMVAVPFLRWARGDGPTTLGAVLELIHEYSRAIGLVVGLGAMLLIPNFLTYNPSGRSARESTGNPWIAGGLALLMITGFYLFSRRRKPPPHIIDDDEFLPHA